MNNAKLYVDNNAVQRQEIRKILAEYFDVFCWRNDGTDSLLDIGCGPGDVTMDLVQRILPKKFKTLMGCDISKKMIDYANQNYGGKSNGHGSNEIDFFTMDIGSDIHKIHDNQYNHITSFFCLHWVANQKQALDNIYRMLTDDGEVLLMFVLRNPFYDIYDFMIKNTKWGKYLEQKDIIAYRPPYHFSLNSCQEFEDVLMTSGFTIFHVEVREQQFHFNDTALYQSFSESVNPCRNRIPLDMLDDFNKNFIDCSDRMKITCPDKCGNGFSFSYKVLIGFARK